MADRLPAWMKCRCGWAKPQACEYCGETYPAPDRERVAEAIWQCMAPQHRLRWDDAPDKELYRSAADAALGLFHAR